MKWKDYNNLTGIEKEIHRMQSYSLQFDGEYMIQVVNKDDDAFYDVLEIEINKKDIRIFYNFGYFNIKKKEIDSIVHSIDPMTKISIIKLK